MIGQNLSLWGVWLYLSVSVMSLWLLIRIFTKFWTTESSELFFQLILNYGVHFCGVKKPLLYSSWVATIVSCTFHWQMVPFHIPSFFPFLSTAVNALSLLNINKPQSKYVFSNFHGHKMHLLALLGFSTPKMTDFPTLSFTSTSEFLTRSYTWA